MKVDSKPQAVLFDVHGTVFKPHFISAILLPYIDQNVCQFFEENFAHSYIHQLIDYLRVDASLDSNGPQIPRSDDRATLIDSTVKVVKHCLDHNKVTLKSIILLRFHMWFDGYKRNRLETPVYSEVVSKLRKWHLEEGVKLYVLSNGWAKANKTFLSKTNQGNLNELIDDHFDSSMGPLSESDTFMKVLNKLTLRSSQVIFLTRSSKKYNAATKAGLVVQRSDDDLKFDETLLQKSEEHIKPPSGHCDHLSQLIEQIVSLNGELAKVRKQESKAIKCRNKFEKKCHELCVQLMAEKSLNVETLQQYREFEAKAEEFERLIKELEASNEKLKSQIRDQSIVSLFNSLSQVEQDLFQSERKRRASEVCRDELAQEVAILEHHIMDEQNRISASVKLQNQLICEQTALHSESDAHLERARQIQIQLNEINSELAMEQDLRAKSDTYHASIEEENSVLILRTHQLEQIQQAERKQIIDQMNLIRDELAKEESEQYLAQIAKDEAEEEAEKLVAQLEIEKKLRNSENYKLERIKAHERKAKVEIEELQEKLEAEKYQRQSIERQLENVLEENEAMRKEIVMLKNS